MEYPPIPISMASTTHKIKMQIVLNNALRFIHCNEHEQLNISELHIKYNINLLNISVHQKEQKIWETIRVTENEHYNMLVIPHANKHTWFPKYSNIITSEPPQAILTYYLPQINYVGKNPYSHPIPYSYLSWECLSRAGASVIYF